MQRTLVALIHGDSGVGKSWLGDTAPAPRLVVDAEGSVEFTPSNKIVWDPATQAPPKADGTWDTCVVRALSYEILDKVYQWLASGDHDFKSVVFDHLTEIQKRIISHFNGTQALREADWGTLLRHMEDWLRRHRDLRYHPTRPMSAVIFVAATTDRDDKIRPALQGQFRDLAPYMVDLVGYMFNQTDENGNVLRRLLITPQERFVAKCRPDALFRKYGTVIDNPNITTMVEVINE